MSFLSRLFKRPASVTAPEKDYEAEHAVFVHLPLANDEFGEAGEFDEKLQLEHAVEDAIRRSGAGMLDGNEIGGGEFVIFTYGPDADRLWAAIEPVVRAYDCRPGAFAIKRYGGPVSGRKERVDLR